MAEGWGAEIKVEIVNKIQLDLKHLDFLDDNVVYAPFQIANIAIEKDQYPHLFEFQDIRLQKQVIRVLLQRFATINHFPKQGDDAILLANQVALPSWYGSRWKGVML